ncbi:hypothetical protein ABID22_000378 [Pontibacter aydingkolensis]|uniref:SH3 domain-containing protein n=1 Tax=Pontibacter aydingkolensis TaxID=1911536 RepID=A0ABS7CR09_9BACT|nr:hypothetical protein [Pontibacter aydingkolensis]MBW7465957.1 hypothetical protein [Pontibacter aydingkolensis]
MRILLLSGIIIVLLATACRENNREAIEQDSSEATMASETGKETPLPSDVLFATKPLIGGELYSKPDFQSTPVASFDTSQSIHILDSTHAIFVHARIRKDTSILTGYIPKTILPEKKQ